jgi:hypothetical protein
MPQIRKSASTWCDRRRTGVAESLDPENIYVRPHLRGGHLACVHHQAHQFPKQIFVHIGISFPSHVISTSGCEWSIAIPAGQFWGKKMGRRKMSRLAFHFSAMTIFLSNVGPHLQGGRAACLHRQAPQFPKQPFVPIGISSASRRDASLARKFRWRQFAQMQHVYAPIR